ncbi:ATP-binding protein [Azonexus sp.]|uniref:ATP-binding protein n=1 Tax=Azonexus sp. TaxID=1872668 RepID=UPI0035AE2360
MRCLPRSLFGRLLLLMTAGLVLAQLAGTAIHLRERQRSLGDIVSQEMVQRFAAIHRAIDGEPGAVRQRLADRLSTPRLALTIEASAPQAGQARTMLTDFVQRMREQLGPGIEVRTVALPRFGTFAFDMYLQLSDGNWLRINGSAPDDILAQPWHMLINLGVMLLAIVVLVAFVARSTVRPLTRLAAAANGLAEDLKHPPLAEEGPSEVQESARAFNLMQTRIRSGIEERERFLAAVSHDLKTPITRLRLRAEMMADKNLREDIRRDVNDMQQLIDDALDFLRGKAVDEAIQPIDLVALVESVADDFSNNGLVTLEAPEQLRFNGRPRALQRALRNLVDNAVKYGGNARVALGTNGGEIVLGVEDDGPGIPESELESVFEPFHRVESSRSRETGGTGLGLAIVRQVVHGHGGSVMLCNRPEGGLRVEVRIPS